MIFDELIVDIIERCFYRHKYDINNKQNKKLIDKLISNKDIKYILYKGRYKEELKRFQEDEIMFNFKGYQAFLINLLENNKDFQLEVNEYMALLSSHKSKNLLKLLKVVLLTLIGFIINDIFQYISLTNDRYEEKKHTIFIV